MFTPNVNTELLFLQFTVSTASATVPVLCGTLSGDHSKKTNKIFRYFDISIFRYFTLIIIIMKVLFSILVEKEFKIIPPF